VTATVAACAPRQQRQQCIGHAIDGALGQMRKEDMQFLMQKRMDQ
jgi:hypothetical protein